MSGFDPKRLRSAAVIAVPLLAVCAVAIAWDQKDEAHNIESEVAQSASCAAVLVGGTQP